ncbi:MAG: diaminopimelate dehydrogenase, partial [Lachnospiraceae bacterium]|nr:diaminopimelate dehydrogenase [Lachnospiraceae bacterium]
AVRAGKNPSLSTRDKHTRECYVVLAEGFDSAEEKARIEKEIVTMPDYFADYDTTVTFLTMEELEKNHKGLPHGGRVFRTGKTGFEKEHGHVIEYSLNLDSNPEFTGSVLAAYARAVHRLHTEGRKGALTVFDIAPAYLSAMSPEDMRAHLL